MHLGVLFDPNKKPKNRNESPNEDIWVMQNMAILSVMKCSHLSLDSRCVLAILSMVGAYATPNLAGNNDRDETVIEPV